MPQTMMSQFPHTSRLSHLPSIFPTLADAYFWLVVVWKFIGMWSFKALVFYFYFFIFCSILCMPKQWYHISHMPPARCTSSPYFPSLWTSIFGWFLCESLLISSHPKAMEYFIYIFFIVWIAAPNDGTVTPHTLSHPCASTQTSPLPLPPTIGWLMVIVIDRWPPKANTCPSLCFLMRLFLATLTG